MKPLAGCRQQQPLSPREVRGWEGGSGCRDHGPSEIGSSVWFLSVQGVCCSVLWRQLEKGTSLRDEGDNKGRSWCLGSLYFASRGRLLR